jgi:enamine deaminase RidA (YjgF/YER057c/UK114 family)
MPEPKTFDDLDALVLPQPPTPRGNYERGIVHRGVGVLSGQFPIVNGTLAFTGRVGLELTEAQGREAAEITALNVLAQIKALLGSFRHFETLLRVDGYVACAPGWTRQPAVLDGASDLFVRLLGKRGRHARSAISVPELPLGAPIELVVTFGAVESFLST